MRARPHSFADFSDREWAEIRTIVGHLGMDAETLSVKGYFLDQQPLRSALVFAVRFSSIRAKREELPTAHQIAKYLEAKREEILAFMRSFGNEDPPQGGNEVIVFMRSLATPLVGYGHPYIEEHFIGWDEYLTSTKSPLSYQQRCKIYQRLLWALLDYQKALGIEARRFAAVRRSNKNAAKPAADRNLYLDFALLTWLRLGGDKAPAKLTNDFLLACTRPAFPSTNGKIVQNWIERHGQWSKTWVEQTDWANFRELSLSDMPQEFQERVAKVRAEDAFRQWEADQYKHVLVFPAPC
jgi:hypothetical protein